MISPVDCKRSHRRDAGPSVFNIAAVFAEQTLDVPRSLQPVGDMHAIDNVLLHALLPKDHLLRLSLTTWQAAAALAVYVPLASHDLR